jgi:nitrite reductase (NADH) large subunit
VVEDPALRAKFRHFVNSDESDENIEYVDMRGQKRPVDWSKK